MKIKFLDSKESPQTTSLLLQKLNIEDQLYIRRIAITFQKTL